MPPMKRGHLPAALLCLLLASCSSQGPTPDNEDGGVTIRIIGTNDVHGELMPKADRGGLVTVSAYVEALRHAYSDDVVLLIDAGDMWQGSLESNLVEGAVMIDAYNAMGYSAAAIGNHELDFGPVGKLAIPRSDDDDARGALRMRATEAEFPLLAANLIDESTGEPVDWVNVRPSIMIDADGIDIGIIGVMTENALKVTIAANTIGLSVAPLAESIEREARELRRAGADLVIVAAHAGSRCEDFSDPNDLSSCDMSGRFSGEIMHVANALPAGLVDHIIAGHVHQGVAHIVNGISITSSYSNTRAFSRVDFVVKPGTGERLSRTVFAPQAACPYNDTSDGSCIWEVTAPGNWRVAEYEGNTISPDPELVAIAEQARQNASERKQEMLGAALDTPFTLKGNPESPLGNLMTDALLDSVDGDIAIHNVSGGIRNILPAGELTYGAVYEMFPFDNRIVVLPVTGRQLREIIAAQARRSRRRAGFSGMRVQVECNDGRMQVEMVLSDDRVVQDGDTVRVIANDFLALGGDDILTPAMPDGGFEFDNSMPLVRDVVVEWFRGRGRIHAEEFSTGDRPKWRVPPELPESCSLNPEQAAIRSAF